MHVYDSLIIGSGYSSSGYALTKKNCIICEESHCCDTHFYLPLKGFKHVKYTPVTTLGKRLDALFESYGLFKDDSMCPNCFESAFCRFLSGENADILLKCRVVKTVLTDGGIYEVTVSTAEGLNTLYAKNVFDTSKASGKATRYITVLYMGSDGAAAENALSKVFTDATFTTAFYSGRFAMHLPAGEITDINEMLCRIEDKWKTADTDARILYVPPVFAYCSDECATPCTFPNDIDFQNPIAAFEAGIRFAGGEL